MKPWTTSSKRISNYGLSYNLHYVETTERLARVYAMVRALWQDDLVAGHFIRTPHPELDGKTPLEAALTEIGGRQVEKIIERGLHGLPV